MQAKEITTFEATADLLPEGGTATHAIRIVFYLDSDGEERYSFAHEGAALLSSWLGCLELAKEDIIAEIRQDRLREDGEDED